MNPSITNTKQRERERAHVCSFKLMWMIWPGRNRKHDEIIKLNMKTNKGKFLSINNTVKNWNDLPGVTATIPKNTKVLKA